MGEMAADLGVGQKQYSLMERGLWALRVPYTTITHVYENESHAIMRRRMGMSMTDLANRLGCSVTYVSQMEAAAYSFDKLTHFWLCGGDELC